MELLIEQMKAYCIWIYILYENISKSWYYDICNFKKL
jgi:hypothetical protein